MKGIYCLFIDVEDCSIDIGAKGKMDFPQGLYVYVGSAQNSIEKRITRHLSGDKKVRWHIDYLLASEKARVVRIAYKEAPKEEECAAASAFAEDGIPIKGFGCSDCSCNSHLIRVDKIDTRGMKIYEKRYEKDCDSIR